MLTLSASCSCITCYASISPQAKFMLQNTVQCHWYLFVILQSVLFEYCLVFLIIKPSSHFAKNKISLLGKKVGLQYLIKKIKTKDGLFCITCFMKTNSKMELVLDKLVILNLDVNEMTLCG